MAGELVRLLALHEGNKRFPYKDTVGKTTIGIGFNLTDVGLYPEEIEFILNNRLRLLESELSRHLPWLDQLDPVRLAVVFDMAYNMGVPVLLTFKTTLGRIKDGNYLGASQSMMQSLWARQVGRRAVRLSEMMRKGEWPDGIAK